MRLSRRCGISLLVAQALSGSAFSATVSDSSTQWKVLGPNFDDLDDQQTGSPSGDIVGQGANQGFFVTFNDNGSSSSTDGTFGFRLRLDATGGTVKKPAFDRVAWVGIDADIDGDIDTFLGLNLQGSQNSIGIYSPGPGLNNSPGTTSVSSTAYRNYALTSSNYNFRAVDHLTDGGTTNDVTTNTTGDPDYYVSFMVPFTDVVSFLAGKSIPLTDQSPMRYILTISTQTNNINQDIGGVNGGLNSTASWGDIGAFTSIVNASGTVIPEPSALLLTVIAQFPLLMRRKRD